MKSAFRGLDPEVLHTLNGEKWKRVGLDRKAGVLSPLFSLRTKDSAGAGEILDLTRLVDWCVLTGQRIIQLLPINDTAGDPSPYGTCSAFALNPICLSLQDVPGADPADAARLKHEFDGLDRVPYNRLRRAKMGILRKSYDAVKSGLGSDGNFLSFCHANAFWLNPYAAFLVLKDEHAQRAWDTWEEIPSGNEKTVRAVLDRCGDESRFHMFLQWQLDRQMRLVRSYANDRGVLLKGDLPFLLNMDSADVWAWPHYFNLNLAAGCPPDYYNANGQYWGFPTYRWDGMERDGHLWWKERLKHAESYYDIFRIDHVLGFFRIWSIPRGQPAFYGQYVPSIPVTRDILGKNSSESEDLSELVRKKILLPSFDSAEAYTFRWQFYKYSAYRSLPEALQNKLRQFEEYYPEHDDIQNDVWRDHGENLLTVLSQNTRMLVCAEDLGTVPACVRPCLRQLGITALVVDRWSKFIPSWRQKRQGMQEYWIEPWDCEPLSVSSPSNHDMSTLRGWWREIGQNERWEHQRRFGRQEEPSDHLDAEGVRSILKRNLDGNSIFSIFLIREYLDLNSNWQSPDPAADRINLPGTVSDTNWTWRMPVSLEELCAASELNRQVSGLIHESGRSSFSSQKSNI